MGGGCIPKLHFWANKDLCQNFFTPQAFAYASDFSGSRVNGTTFTILFDIYTKGRNTTNYPLPSKSTVNREKE